MASCWGGQPTPFQPQPLDDGRSPTSFGQLVKTIYSLACTRRASSLPKNDHPMCISPSGTDRHD